MCEIYRIILIIFLQLIGTYTRTDPDILRTAEDQLKSGMSCEQVYFSNNKENDEPNKILNLKSVQNLKYQLNKGKNAKEELDVLVDAVRSNKFVKVLKVQGDRYSAIAFKDHMLKDMKRFCVEGDSLFTLDTTFDLLPGLWVTDTAYQCLALYDINNRHPHFPGPMMLHFKKDTLEFQTFASELVNQCGALRGIKKVGHDLDAATANGFTSVLPDAQHLWCTEHLQNRTVEKLRKMHVNERIQNKVMSDLYGVQNMYLHEDGLADAENDEDLEVKLASLEDSWANDIPWFADWFKKHQLTIFKECLTLSARKSLGISDRFYTNNIENNHRLQKKKLKEVLGPIKGGLMDVVDALEKWIDENFVQEVALALRGSIFGIYY